MHVTCMKNTTVGKVSGFPKAINVLVNQISVPCCNTLQNQCVLNLFESMMPF